MKLLLDRPADDPDLLPAEREPSRWSGSLARVALLPSAAMMVAAVAVVLVTLISTGSDLSGAAGAVGGIWLVIHQIPVRIDGVDIAILPLVPTAIMVAVVVRAAMRATDPGADPRRQLQVLGAAAGGAAAMTVVAATLLDDAAGDLPLQGPPVLAVFAIVIAVHVAAAATGVAIKVHRQWLDRWAMPLWIPRAIGAGVAGVLALLAAGAVLVTLALIVAWSQVQGMFELETTAVGRIGLLVVSLLYLPNLIVFGAGLLTGATVTVGPGSYAVFDVVPGPVPEVPILAVLPDEPIGPGWVGLLAVGLGVSVLLGRYLRIGVRTVEGLRVWAVVAMVAATLTAALGGLAGGTLGVYETVGMDTWAPAGLAIVWCALVPALGVTAVEAVAERRAARADAVYQEQSADRDRDEEDSADDLVDDDVLDPTEDAELAQAAEYAEDDDGFDPDDEYADDEYADDEDPADAEPGDDDQITADAAATELDTEDDPD